MTPTDKSTRLMHTYGAGTRLSSAYTAGRQGKPCPRSDSEPSSQGYRAYKQGLEEFRQSHRDLLALCKEVLSSHHIECFDAPAHHAGKCLDQRLKAAIRAAEQEATDAE